MAVTNRSLIEQLEPISKLSAGRKVELVNLCFTEKINKDIDPLRLNVTQSAQALYLLRGDLGVRFNDNTKLIIRGGTDAAKYPLNDKIKIRDSIALTDIEIVRIDVDLLDIMVTWDQLSGSESLTKKPIEQTTAKEVRSPGDWMNETEVFSVQSLQKGVFSKLPVANVEEMFKRMTRVFTSADQVVIQQGDLGDYYYLIQSGSAVVSRVVDYNQPPVMMAVLHEGSAFGEDALVSDNKRNATITMKTEGELLRLNKQDFVELLKAPLIMQTSLKVAEAKVAAGAVWVDVRFPSEYKYDHINGAINLPLNEIRQMVVHLDRSKEYIMYCQTGRRSSAAAFILMQHGLQASVLEGGTRQTKSR